MTYYLHLTFYKKKYYCTDWNESASSVAVLNSSAAIAGKMAPFYIGKEFLR